MTWISFVWLNHDRVIKVSTQAFFIVITIFSQSIIVLQRHKKKKSLSFISEYYRNIKTPSSRFRSTFGKLQLITAKLHNCIITAKLLSDDWFLFSIFLIIFLRKTMLNLVNILTHKERKQFKRKSSAGVECPK